jgi:hypothetical protein
LSPFKKPPIAIVHVFTRDQAKTLIEAKGFSSVSGLRRDVDGVWHGSAEKDGAVRNVNVGQDGDVGGD